MIKRIITHKKKIAKYLVAGVTALASDLLALYLFTHVLHVWYLASSVIAFIVSFLVAFFLQKFWTFNNPSTEKIKRQIGISLAVALFNLLLNTFLVYIFVEYLFFNYLIAQIGATAIIAIESFLIYQFVIFVA